MNSIRFVPTGLHGYLDYIGGIGLIAAPFVFGFFSVGGIAVILPMVLGVGLILYSLLTNYERGIPALKFIPAAGLCCFRAACCLTVSAWILASSPERLVTTPYCRYRCYPARPGFADAGTDKNQGSRISNIRLAPVQHYCTRYMSHPEKDDSYSFCFSLMPKKT